MYQTWYFPEKSNNVFKDYIRVFNKIKQCCSYKDLSQQTPEVRSQIEKLKLLGIDSKKGFSK